MQLSHNLYGDHGAEVDQWFLSYVSRFLNHVWTQGQIFLDGPNRTVTFAWNEEYQVDMKPIYRERMRNDDPRSATC